MVKHGIRIKRASGYVDPDSRGLGWPLRFGSIEAPEAPKALASCGQMLFEYAMSLYTIHE
jgi:hypothetical protein